MVSLENYFWHPIEHFHLSRPALGWFVGVFSRKVLHLEVISHYGGRRWGKKTADAQPCGQEPHLESVPSRDLTLVILPTLYSLGVYVIVELVGRPGHKGGSGNRDERTKYCQHLLAFSRAPAALGYNASMLT